MYSAKIIKSLPTWSFGGSVLENHQSSRLWKTLVMKYLYFTTILNSAEPWKLICFAWWEKSQPRYMQTLGFAHCRQLYLTKHLPALLILPDCWIFWLFICLLPLADFFINSLNIAICCFLPSVRSGLEQPADKLNYGRIKAEWSYFFLTEI